MNKIAKTNNKGLSTLTSQSKKEIITFFAEKINQCPMRIQDMTDHQNSLNDFMKLGSNVQTSLTASIAIIVTKYVGMVQNDILNSEAKTKLLCETIINNFGNLELQEVEYVLKNGVAGRFGTIYRTVDISTICGVGENCWFENYYKTDRQSRPEPNGFIYEKVKKGGSFYYTKKEPKDNYTPPKSAISYAEFIKRNPDKKDELFISEMRIKIKNSKPIQFEEIFKALKVSGVDQERWYDIQRRLFIRGRKKGKYQGINEIQFITMNGIEKLRQLLN